MQRALVQMCYSTSESGMEESSDRTRWAVECATSMSGQFGLRLTCFEPPEYAVLGVLHRREAAHLGRERDAERVVAAPHVLVRAPGARGPQRLRRVEEQVDLGDREARARLVAADGDGDARRGEQPVVVLDARAHDALDGDLGEPEVARVRVRAPALVALDGGDGEVDHSWCWVRALRRTCAAVVVVVGNGGEGAGRGRRGRRGRKK